MKERFKSKQIKGPASDVKSSDIKLIIIITIKTAYCVPSTYINYHIESSK